MPSSVIMAREEQDSWDESFEMPLKMDYWVEELSEAQTAHYSKANKEYSDIMAKVSDFLHKEKGSIVECGSEILVLQGSGGAPTVSVLSSLVTPVSQTMCTNQMGRVLSLQTQPQPQMPALQAVSGQQLVLQSGPVSAGGRVVAAAVATTAATAAATATIVQSTGTLKTPQGTIQLVMDPIMGIFVGSLPNQQGSGTQTVQPTLAPPNLQPVPIQTGPNNIRGWARSSTSSVLSIPTPVAVPLVQASSTQAPSTQTPLTKAPSTKASSTKAPSTKAPSTKAPSIKASSISTSVTASTVTASTATTTSVVSSLKPSKIRNVASGSSAPAPSTMPVPKIKPSESNSIGGLSAGNTRKSAQDDGKTNAHGPDSKEVTFNKLSGKTFPSLVVLARPHLKMKEMSQAKVNQERSSLDSKVKCVLMFTAPKFSEWLIQQGLVRNEQYCNVHSGKDGPSKLKLIMYSDPTKFPYSGGYVWASDCCPHRYVSIFNRSVFEGAPHPPSVLLKLMYHWCCQTNVQNVVQWVKVDNFYVKNFFTYMRSVCVAAVHENYDKLGGPQKRVEVGVISLGTTSQDSNMRQVKVEVLGVMDPESKLVRLRAVEPLQDGERNYKRRFVKILEPLRFWVHPESVILTDFTVDKSTLIGMGFSQVHQSTIPDPPSTASKLSNQNIMEYLRRIVPRMFQNTLSLLSRQIIQQFLDELVWRERWGPIPSQAFDSLVSHIAAQSKIDAVTGDSLIVKLGKIAANPFRSWQYEHWCTNGQDLSTVPQLDLASLLAPPPLHSLVPFKVFDQNKAEALPPDHVSEEFSPPSIALAKPYNFEVNEELETKVKLALQKSKKITSLKEVVETFNLPRSIVIDMAKDFIKTKSVQGQPVFSESEEQDLCNQFITLCDWGYPLGRWDIRMLVKQYLDICTRCENRFKDNFPNDLWIEKFLVRHPFIKDKMCRNIPSRGAFIDTEAAKQYILNLSSVVQNVPPENILNFMEVGLTGDPLKSMTLELRELRYPVGKRKVKSSAAIMLACTALGKVLPTFIIFEGKPVVIDQGDFLGEYYATKTGWFDETAFQQWVESVLIPWADGIKGKKVLVGDSLAQLFNLKTMALCMDKDISVVSMPCSISGILSPLDVVLCDILQAQWRTQTRSWASSHSDKFITVEEFPAHIHQLLTSAITPEIPEQLRKAFKSTGLNPFNSKNSMDALEKGGVIFNDTNYTRLQEDPKKRKRVYIEADDVAVKKNSENSTSVVEEVVLDDGDSEKDIVSSQEAINCPKDTLSLESYYYGSIPPNEELVRCETKLDDLNIKCPLCLATVHDNLTLMKHLLGHSGKQPSVEQLSSINLCRYCAKLFPTPKQHEEHLQKEHKGILSLKYACLICSQNMQNKDDLVAHMQKLHTRLELPYLCTICAFRGSEQYKLVDHFYEVHAGGEKIQCPYCLKCVAISNMGRKMPANTFFFMHHVKKHQSYTSSRKCEKCSLWFVHKGILREHQMKDHISCKDDPNVVPYFNGSVDMLSLPKKLAVRDYGVLKKISHTSLRNLVIHGVEPSHKCLECKSHPVLGHFVNCLFCLQCNFTTCCNVVMKEHIKSSPCKGRLKFASEQFLISLPAEMHCMCGFKTRDGNFLATHLVHCKRRTAYPSADSARAAAAYFIPQPGTNPIPEKDSQTGLPMLRLFGLAIKRSMDKNASKYLPPVESEAESIKDGHLNQASTTSGLSNSRKRNARDAGLESSTEITEVKDKRRPPESHSLSETGYLSSTDSNCDSSQANTRNSINHQAPSRAKLNASPNEVLVGNCSSFDESTTGTVKSIQDQMCVTPNKAVLNSTKFQIPPKDHINKSGTSLKKSGMDAPQVAVLEQVIQRPNISEVLEICDVSSSVSITTVSSESKAGSSSSAEKNNVASHEMENCDKLRDKLSKTVPNSKEIHNENHS